MTWIASRFTAATLSVQNNTWIVNDVYCLLHAQKLIFYLLVNRIFLPLAKLNPTYDTDQRPCTWNTLKPGRNIWWHYPQWERTNFPSRAAFLTHGDNKFRKSIGKIPGVRLISPRVLLLLPAFCSSPQVNRTQYRNLPRIDDVLDCSLQNYPSYVCFTYCSHGRTFLKHCMLF